MADGGPVTQNLAGSSWLAVWFCCFAVSLFPCQVGLATPTNTGYGCSGWPVALAPRWQRLAGTCPSSHSRSCPSLAVVVVVPASLDLHLHLHLHPPQLARHRHPLLTITLSTTAPPPVPSETPSQMTSQLPSCPARFSRRKQSVPSEEIPGSDHHSWPPTAGCFPLTSRSRCAKQPRKTQAFNAALQSPLPCRTC